MYSLCVPILPIQQLSSEQNPYLLLVLIYKLQLLEYTVGLRYPTEKSAKIIQEYICYKCYIFIIRE